METLDIPALTTLTFPLSQLKYAHSQVGLGIDERDGSRVGRGDDEEMALQRAWREMNEMALNWAWRDGIDGRRG
jgi:hypothetical protein